MSKELTQQLIGKILSRPVERDAIHIAVAPVVAGETLKPGQHIGLKGSETATSAEPHVGIVDPFLEWEADPGDLFFMFLYPNTVTGLRHEWMHPAFKEDVAKSKRWLTDFAESNETTYEDLLEQVRRGSVYFGSTNWQDIFFGGGKDDFWTHYENVTGAPVSRLVREKTSFSCSC